MKPIGHYAPRVKAALEFSESPIESELFWAMMNSHKFILCKPEHKPEGVGYFVFPQYDVGPYRADFMILARDILVNPKLWGQFSEAKIIIECDGRQFHSTPEQLEHDRKRDAFLRGEGYKILRLKGTLIHRNGSFCADEVENFIKITLRGMEAVS